MPAQLDDPLTPPHPRRSGAAPYPSHPTALPPSMTARPLKLRTGTAATLLPLASPSQLPAPLLAHLCATLAAEIAAGDTYPMLDAIPSAQFGPYWFGAFGAVAVRGDAEAARRALADAATDWRTEALGTFYVKPNYPGRSSHVCNAGFLVCEGARGCGVGRAMGEAYLEWAPALGYSYSVFNLVYATNVASRRIWDALGFEVIGRVPGCGHLKSSPGVPVDALVYGRAFDGAQVADVDQGEEARGVGEAVVGGV